MRVIEKLTSGRFIVTLVASYVFAYMATTGLLDAKETSIIVTAVLLSYFNRQRTNGAT